MVETEITLVEKMAQLLCDPESPRFSKPYHDGTGLFISDGRMLLAFGDIQPPEGVPCWVKVDGKYQIEDKFRIPPEKSAEIVGKYVGKFVTGVLPVPSVDGPPKCCNALWAKIEECEPCDGLGYRECDMGHDHDCEDCGGKGEFLQVCDEARDEVDILESTFARRYVWVMSQLPGVKLCPYVKDEMLGFTFDGGKGVLMAIMKDRE